MKTTTTASSRRGHLHLQSHDRPCARPRSPQTIKIAPKTNCLHNRHRACLLLRWSGYTMCWQGLALQLITNPPPGFTHAQPNFASSGRFAMYSCPIRSATTFGVPYVAVNSVPCHPVQCPAAGCRMPRHDFVQHWNGCMGTGTFEYEYGSDSSVSESFQSDSVMTCSRSRVLSWEWQPHTNWWKVSEGLQKQLQEGGHATS